MNPRTFPRRLDSKTSCLRIAVPENLDLALEGLIRKVLREQPRTEDIYAFAAEYFEALLRIRDKAGAEYTATQLCPFHNDEEAREMIVLAGTFPKQVPGGVRGKRPAPLKTETKKENDKAEPEKGFERPKDTLRESKAEAENKQATPDLIKKLPVLGQNQGVLEEKATEAGPDGERTETVKEEGDEEEYLTSDPIKEFVEKELLTGGKSEERAAEGEGPKASESPTAREGQSGEAEGGRDLVASNADEKRDADGGNGPGATGIVGGVARAKEDGGGEKIEPEMRETDEKGVEARYVAKDAEDKIGEAAKPEAEEERQEKTEKGNKEESRKVGEKEESQGGVEPPPPRVEEKRAQEPVEEVSGSYITEAQVPGEEPEGGKVIQSAGSSEVASKEEKGMAEVGGAQQPSEGKSEAEGQPSTASPVKIAEESPETPSLVTESQDTKPVENDAASSAESEKSEKRKEERESGAWSEGEGQEPRTETASEQGERRLNGSESGSSSEAVRGAQEEKEGGAPFEEEGLHQTKGVESNKGRENQDTEAEAKSTEEEAKASRANAAEAEDGAGQPRTGAEESTAEEKGTELSGKLDASQKVVGSEILKEEQFGHSQPADSKEEAESKREEEGGKAGRDEKSSEEEVKGKEQSPREPRESAGGQTPGEVLLRRAEDVQGEAEAPGEESADAHGRQTPPGGTSSTTEEPKSEEEGDAKQGASRDGPSPTADSGLPTEAGETPEMTTRDTESAEPQEFKTEDAPTAENGTNEELCSVVDINHLRRDEGNQEEPKVAEPPPDKAAEEKPAPEPEGPPSSSAQSEVPNRATATHEPVKAENDKEKDDSQEKASPGTWDFGPSTEGRQTIIVEEPEETNEDPDKFTPPGEVQIKTIQTHYYDTLRVPETVTREYRVHGVLVPTIDALLAAPSPPPSARDHDQPPPTAEEPPGRPPEDTALPPTPNTSPAGDGGVPTHAEPPQPHSYTEPPCSPSRVTAEAPLALDARATGPDDLPHPTTPTSDLSSSLSELSLQAASETFLTNEQRFSSLEKEEIRFVTPATEEAAKGEPEGRPVNGRRETDEGGDETAPPSTGGLRSPPRTPERTEAGGASTGGRPEDVQEDGSRLVGSSGGPPTASAEPPPRGEHEGAPDAPRPPSGARAEHAEDVQGRTAPAAESAEKEPFHSKTQEGNVPEEGQEGSRPEGRTPTGEASYAETDSTTSSATTAVKRADSVRREFASARGLSSARSLDLGRRNPLLRTRSLSTHRHGVADFEVWNTIEKELEEAATKIQSKFRGYNARKKLRRELAVQISTEDSSKSSTPKDPDRDPRATGELHDAIVLPHHPR